MHPGRRIPCNIGLSWAQCTMRSESWQAQQVRSFSSGGGVQTTLKQYCRVEAPFRTLIGSAAIGGPPAAPRQSRRWSLSGPLAATL
eukprot:4326237-Alexandrium_andersonii.AAC.1